MSCGVWHDLCMLITHCNLGVAAVAAVLSDFGRNRGEGVPVNFHPVLAQRAGYE